MGRLLFLLVIKHLLYTVSCKQFVVDGDYGNDDNSGLNTQEAFKTIQRCVEELKLGEPGDECQIRSGRYHEVVHVNGLQGTADKPIIIKGYGDERPVWDGTVPIQPSNWDYNFESGICSAVIDNEIFALFLNDDLLTPARWPNALWSDKTIFNNTHWSPCDKSSSYGNIVDFDLANSGIDATGVMAILNIGSWVTYVRPVLDHEMGSQNFTYNHDMGDVPWKPNHNQYYLEAGLSLLDAPEEWVYDNSSKTLYFIPPNGICPDPSSNSLRGRNLDYGLIITDSSWLNIANITFMASNINAYSESKPFTQINEIKLDSLTFKFASASHRMLGSTDEPLFTKLTAMCHSHGVKLYGRVSVVNCTFEGSESLALVHNGIGNLIHNNLFIYNDWTGYWSGFDGQGGGDLHGSGYEEVISQNTFWYNGDTNSIRPGANATVKYNHITGTCAGKIKSDGAAIQVVVDNQKGSIISHNWVHDTPKKGIRFDTPIPVGTTFGTDGYSGYNVVWDTLEMEIKGDNHTIENNLVIDKNSEDRCSLCVVYRFYEDPTIMNNQSTVINNGASQADGGQHSWPYINWPLPGEDVENNYSGKNIRENLMDPDNWDFRPIDGGAFTQGDVIIGPYLPSSQAKNYYWIPGRKIYKTSTPIPTSGAYVPAKRDVVMFLSGYMAEKHLFFIGTDEALVEKATQDDEEFQYILAEEEGNVLNLPELLNDTTYFWRVDVQKGGYLYKGDVWNFTTR
ncbi:unnamed protein product [Meganyctiphanes norvegica]|uniref:Right handed beta helix domain-containing protein n=1 Tax=Meganyctiphanes norvegica TaxID=48144 RepID=A0AAV2QFL0_MEGNR